MAITIGVLTESQDRRIAMTPDNIKRSKIKDATWWVEQGAGEKAGYSDARFDGLAQLKSRNEILSNADVILSIFPISHDDHARVKPDALVISQYRPYVSDPMQNGLAKVPGKVISVDMIPRTTLAQAMDVLSSMASIAGYRAVILAALQLPRYFPMMITSAGSIKPAKVLVLGAGVAGLQAIATARKLGAVVEAFDVRAAAKEEVKSLGAKFVEVEGAVDDKGAGGYAVQQSEEFLARQRAKVQEHAANADVVICTAQVRGRKAPVLIEAETVGKMKPGSVVIDLAASTGGNCALTQNDQTIVHQGVTIIGNSSLENDMVQDASAMYGNNMLNLLGHITKDGALNLNMEDEIVKGCLIKTT